MPDTYDIPAEPRATMGSGIVYIRDEARVVHFGSPDGEKYVPKEEEQDD